MADGGHVAIGLPKRTMPRGAVLTTGSCRSAALQVLHKFCSEPPNSQKCDEASRLGSHDTSAIDGCPARVGQSTRQSHDVMMAPATKPRRGHRPRLRWMAASSAHSM